MDMAGGEQKTKIEARNQLSPAEAEVEAFEWIFYEPPVRRSGRRLKCDKKQYFRAPVIATFLFTSLPEEDFSMLFIVDILLSL